MLGFLASNCATAFSIHSFFSVEYSKVSSTPPDVGGGWGAVVWVVLGRPLVDEPLAGFVRGLSSLLEPQAATARTARTIRAWFMTPPSEIRGQVAIDLDDRVDAALGERSGARLRDRG